MQIEIIRPKGSAFESLGTNAQDEVQAARESIFYRWPTPSVPLEGKLQWDDDLAILWVEFGGPVLLESISWHRQNAEKRPGIPHLRERCRMIRETQGRRDPKDSAASCEPYGSVAAFDRAVIDHLNYPDDDRFVPFGLLYRDAGEFRKVKMKALANGESLSPAEMREWWLWRTEETDREWAEIRRKRLRSPKPQQQFNLDSLELAEILRSIR